MESPTNGTDLPGHLAVPPIDPEKVLIQTASGEVIEVNQQLHFYTRNSLLGHPLVSPAMSYLGGLPPLLIIAGDKEVLRDEIIYRFVLAFLYFMIFTYKTFYSAHKAAYPEKYAISSDTRELYPSLNGIEARFKPTSVHLQVYDGRFMFKFTTYLSDAVSFTNREPTYTTRSILFHHSCQVLFPWNCQFLQICN